MTQNLSTCPPGGLMRMLRQSVLVLPNIYHPPVRGGSDAAAAGEGFFDAPRCKIIEPQFCWTKNDTTVSDNEVLD